MSVSSRCITILGFNLHSSDLEEIHQAINYEDLLDSPHRLNLREDCNGRIGLVLSEGQDFFGYVIGHTTDENDGAMLMEGSAATQSIKLSDLSAKKGEIWLVWGKMLMDEFDITHSGNFPEIEIHMTMLFN